MYVKRPLPVFHSVCALWLFPGQTRQIFFLEPFFFRKPNIRWRPFPFLLDLIFWLDVSIERGELIENCFKKYIVNQPFSNWSNPGTSINYRVFVSRVREGSTRRTVEVKKNTFIDRTSIKSSELTSFEPTLCWRGIKKHFSPNRCAVIFSSSVLNFDRCYYFLFIFLSSYSSVSVQYTRDMYNVHQIKYKVFRLGCCVARIIP